MNKEELNKYYQMLSYGYEIADEYKNTLVPNRIAKYFYVDKNKRERSIRNIELLRTSEVWMSSYEYFDDKNEFNSIQIFKNDIIERGYSEKEFNKINELYEKNKKSLFISCFTISSADDFMWENYANNYQGFAIEYKVKDKLYLYPVNYCDEVINGSSLYIDLYENLKRDIEAEKYFKSNVISDSAMNIISIIYTLYCRKQVVFSSEKEVRIIYATSKPHNEKGRKIAYKDIGLEPAAIIIGCHMSKEYKNLIRQLAKEKKLKIIKI